MRKGMSQMVVVLVLVLVVIAVALYVWTSTGKKVAAADDCSNVRDGLCILNSEQCPEGSLESGFSCPSGKYCCTPVIG